MRTLSALIGVLLAVACLGAGTVLMTADTGQQRGLAMPTWDRGGYAEASTDVAIDQVVEVGANWVQIIATWYQPTADASRIEPTDAGSDDDGIRRAVKLAHERGLKVLLKPHVDVADGTPRVEIRPADLNAWFASYTEMIVHYAELAADLDVAQFSVGTELSEVSGERARWTALIGVVRDRYPGSLVYAANHPEFAGVAFWDQVDVIGVDAYWPLSTDPTTDVAALERSFEPIREQLAALSEQTGRRVLFTEAGYASQVGSTTAPWSESVSRKPSQAEQAAAYEALLRSFSGEKWWAGVFWWDWTELESGNADASDRLGHSVRGKAAEQVIRRWWQPQP